MTYEWGYTTAGDGGRTIDRVRAVLDYAVSVMPAEKILLGVPNYGYDWTLPFRQGTAARALTNVAAVTLAGTVGAEIRFSQTARAPYFRYTDSEGRRHEVWFEDARSLQAKYRLVAEYGLAGVSFWNLNRLFRTNFLLLDAMYDVTKVR
jgi:spore germination protein